MGYWGIVNNNLKNSDIVLIIVDSRMPEDTRNKEIEKKIKLLGKKLILIFNKTDLIEKRAVKELMKHYPGSFFTTSKNRGSFIKLKKSLETYSSNKEGSLRVGIVGYPNVGKSTVLNFLTGSNEKVSSVSGTTRKTKWVRVGKIRYIDTPGVIPERDSKSKTALTSSKDIYTMENPEKIAIKLIRKIKNKKIFDEKYGISTSKEDSPNKIIEKIGKKRKYLLKGGKIDEDKTSRLIVSDWQKGRIALISKKEGEER